MTAWGMGLSAEARATRSLHTGTPPRISSVHGILFRGKHARANFGRNLNRMQKSFTNPLRLHASNKRAARSR